MKVAITTDHAGFESLKELKVYIENLGHTCVSYGPDHFDADDDYPDFMFPAAEAVARGECDRGVIMGGSGQGEAMAANRVKGVRAAVFYGPVVAKVAVDAEGNMSDDPYEIVKLSREHNDANVLSLSGRFLTMDEMKQALGIWLETPFSGAERHARRIAKLDGIARERF
jgi:ribose 5-phosphate isomerase B